MRGGTAMLFTKKSPGHLAENVMHFARVLRTAGMPVGSDRVQLALQALQVAGWRAARLPRRAVACLLDRIEHRRAVRPGLRPVLARPRPDGPHARAAAAQGAA
jgi:uncharacterized protein with von Willebrand factor type A (vWA) domain